MTHLIRALIMVEGEQWFRRRANPTEKNGFV
jgi:hypothetical protein